MTPDFSGAPCIGRPELFESTHTADHYEARELCATCPALEACKVLLQDELVATRGTRKAGGGPCGTWAGERVGARKKPPGKPREHGTTRGYHQHKNRKENACFDCCEAMRIATNERRHGPVVDDGISEHRDPATPSGWDNQSGARGTLVTSPGTSTRANPVRGSASRGL